MFELRKYFRPINYFYKWNKIRNTVILNKLILFKTQKSEICSIWKTCILPESSYPEEIIQCSYIFGTPLNYNDINWFKDTISGYEFKLDRIDRLQIHDIFNKDIDIKYPWELSRFYFGIKLAYSYLITGEDKYYYTFRKLVRNFIELNPFPFGINWVSPMETAIRAVNWIISINLFSNIISRDSDFKEQISKSLIDHSDYLYNFPEVYYHNHTTNHAISNYAGLLFLALSFPKYSKSGKWLKQALQGLEHCIDYQIYDDGVDFESSIPYHRLVLEILSYSTIIAHSNNLMFSKKFYKKLFKMFEFTASYIDQNGNAPQIGDNDSGRFIMLEQSAEEPSSCYNDKDHSYLLTLGEHLFNYKFKSQCNKRATYLNNFLPVISRMNVTDLTIPRNTDKSIMFNDGGAYFLKNDIFSLLVSCFPIGQNGRGGHNHLDNGSFTLSIKGKQAIVDPGTKTYTRSKRERDKFRSYSTHNTLYTTIDQDLNLDDNSYWELKEYYKSTLLDFSATNIKIAIKHYSDPRIRFRIFSLYDNILSIRDEYSSNFFSRINLHPNNHVIYYNNKSIITDYFTISIPYSSEYRILDYEYSPHYDKSVVSKCIVFTAIKSLKLYINSHHNSDVNSSLKSSTITK